tara:strand:+ start:38 stop:640 length:603 start_codon:yes stop_codon:yes gene_type:complete
MEFNNEGKNEIEKNVVVENSNTEIDEKKEKELKRISRVDKELKYKSIYLNTGYKGDEENNNKESCNMDIIDNYLEKEKEFNKSQPWNKLNKTNKIDKLKDFCCRFSEENMFSDGTKDNLEKFLLKSLDNKKFTKIKDINYNKEEGLIKDIPGLSFNKNKKVFTIKNQDNRILTSKNLAPKTKKSKDKTKKNKSRENKKID